VFLSTFFWWFVLLVGKLLLWPFPGRRVALRHWVLRNWGRMTLRLAGGRRRVEGHAPRGPGLFVSNHLSYADILLLAGEVPGRFVAKAEIRNWPFVGWMCRTADVLFVDRSSRRDAARVAAEMQQALDAGDTILLFPEGTSTNGHDLLPFRPPLLAPAAAAEMPVHFGALHYRTSVTDPPAFLSICWWGDTPLFPHLPELLGLESFEATLRFGNAPISNRDRKVLAAQLQQAVTELFEPVVDFEPHSPGDPRPRSVVEAEQPGATPSASLSAT
jgi:1-acyl-sn-glycerol-3-phosphate acyltransferase